MSQPLVSLITVVYNAEQVIGKTLESAIAQTFKNFELVIVDGGSKDSTLDIVRQYEPHIGTLISEKDQGIYDAMNKGIKAAKGEWLYFLNAGDLFYNDEVLEEVFTKHDFVAYDFIYGKVQTINEPTGINYFNGKKVTYNDFYFTYPICHQATFTRKKVFEQLGHFNTSLKLTADTEWFTRLFQAFEHKTHFINKAIALYDVQGASYQKRMLGYQEFLSYSPHYFPFYVNVYNYIMYPLIWLKVKLIRTLTGTSLFAYYRKLKFSKS